VRTAEQVARDQGFATESLADREKFERAKAAASLSESLQDEEMDHIIAESLAHETATRRMYDTEPLRRKAAWGFNYARQQLRREGIVGQDAAPILAACRSAVLRAIERHALTVEADWDDVAAIVRKARLIEAGLDHSWRELDDAGVEGAEADRIQAQCRKALEHELLPQSSRPDARSIVDRILDDELGPPVEPDRDLVSSGMTYAREELRKAGVTGARFFRIQSEVQRALEQGLIEGDGQDDACDIADNVLDQHLGPDD